MSDTSDSDYEGNEGLVSFMVHNAAEAGDVDSLERMLGLSETASVPLAQSVVYRRLLSLTDRNDCTPLHLAIINGHPACVKVLLRGGASPSRGCDGSPPLALAACLGLSAEEGRAAAAEGCVRALLEAGADPHDRDDGGRTSLHWAACCWQPSLLPLLLAAAAAAHRTRVGALLADAMEAAAAAAEQRQGAGGEGAEGGEGGGGLVLPALDRPEHILAMTDHDGFTPLHLAARCGHAAVVSELLRAAADSARAAAAAAEELAREAAAADAAGAAAADPASSTAAAVTPAAAAALPSAAAVSSLLPVCEVASLLRMRTRQEGHTPLHLAALYGRAEAAEALLAAAAGGGTAGGVKAAAAVGKLLAAADKKGYTAADLARRRGHTALADALKAAVGGKPFQLPPQAPTSGADASLAASAPAVAVAADPSSTTTATTSTTPASGGSSGSSSNRTLLLAPDDCHLHCTAPEPLVRSGPEPPPENVNRLHVLTRPVTGILHNHEFSDLLHWRTRGIPQAAMVDVLKCHEWSYVRDIVKACEALPDSPASVGSLDPDTAISRGSMRAALAAAGAVCAAVDEVVAGRARNAFCAVRPPGHHAGPTGTVVNPNDPHGSHGFCLLSNVAIGAAYAMSMHRNAGIRRVAILDFDVHHGNGTQACVLNTAPSVRSVPIRTPFSEGLQRFPTYKPWLGDGDVHNIFFASVQGYGNRGGGGWFYPGSGATADSAVAAALKPSSPPPPQPQPAAQSEAPTAAPAAPAEAAMTTPTTSAVPPVGGANTAAEGATEEPGAAAATPAAAPAAAAAAAISGNIPHTRNGGDSGGGDSGGQVVEDPEGEFRGSYDVTVLGGPRVINVGIPGPGSKPRMWRKAWRDKILPALVNFKPDIILVSAGFDAHKKEDLNLRYVGVAEADYEWLTGQIVEVANACCGGRVVSVLEGGYNLRGGPLGSPFARSVAAHVRSLAAPSTARYDPSWAETERAAEKAAERAAEAKRAARAAERAAALAAGLATPGSALPTPRAGVTPGAAAATPATAALSPVAATPAVTAGGGGGGPAPMDTDATSPVAAAPTPTPSVPTAAAAGTTVGDGSVAATPSNAVTSATAAVAGVDGIGSGGSAAAGSDEPPSKRRRRPPVDYAALNAQLERERQEEAAAAAGAAAAATPGGGSGAGTQA